MKREDNAPQRSLTDGQGEASGIRGHQYVTTPSCPPSLPHLSPPLFPPPSCSPPSSLCPLGPARHPQTFTSWWPKGWWTSCGHPHGQPGSASAPSTWAWPEPRADGAVSLSRSVSVCELLLHEDTAIGAAVFTLSVWCVHQEGLWAAGHPPRDPREPAALGQCSVGLCGVEPVVG